MPAPTSALPFAAKAPPSATAAGGNAAASEAPSATKKPAFDEMVRRPAKREDSAPARSTAQAREAKETLRPWPATSGRTADAATPAVAEDDRLEAGVTPPVLPAPADTPIPAAALALLDTPASTPTLLAPPPDTGAAVPTDPLANPLPGASPAAVASPDALLAGGRAVMPTSSPGSLLTPAATGIGDTPGAVSQAGANEASGMPLATTAATDAAAKAPLQNLLSFATHLASGQVAAAIPDAVTLGRDIVDALRVDDADATTPTSNLLAGVGASHAPLGLSRMETVNAMEAPSADLHGGHFDEDIGDAVRWMADQKIGHAHIKVTPHDLGTVEIRLRLEGDRVHADFASTQAEVRQALESSLPRLRDMLGQHGFQLAHADVGQQHAPPSQGSSARQGDDPADASDTAAETPRAVRMTARGLVDAYA